MMAPCDSEQVLPSRGHGGREGEQPAASQTTGLLVAPGSELQSLADPGSLKESIAESHLGFSVGLGFFFCFFPFFFTTALVCGLSFCGWKEESR